MTTKTLRMLCAVSRHVTIMINENDVISLCTLAYLSNITLPNHNNTIGKSSNSDNYTCTLYVSEVKQISVAHSIFLLVCHSH